MHLSALRLLFESCLRRLPRHILAWCLLHSLLRSRTLLFRGFPQFVLLLWATPYDRLPRRRCAQRNALPLARRDPSLRFLFAKSPKHYGSAFLTACASRASRSSFVASNAASMIGRCRIFFVPVMRYVAQGAVFVTLIS